MPNRTLLEGAALAGAADQRMHRPYIPRGCDQQGRAPDRHWPEDCELVNTMPMSFEPLSGLQDLEPEPAQKPKMPRAEFWKGIGVTVLLLALAAIVAWRH